ncbi:MAG: GRP family sugar transporter [Candidatus Omnitrophota bacterium]
MNAFYFAILTALVWGCVPILEKAGLMRIDPMPGLFLRVFGVATGLIVLSIFNIQALKTALKADLRTISLIMLGGFLASVVGQMFFYHALKSGEASKVVPISGTYPLVSFLLGVIFLGESLTISKGFGVLLVVAGLFLLR